MEGPVVDIAELGLAIRSDGVVVAKNRLSAFEKGATRAEKSAGRLQKTADRTSKTFTNLKGVLIAFGAIRFGRKIISDFAEFDRSMTQINTLVGVAQSQVRAWRQDLLNLSPVVAKGPGELADALFFITSAGQRGSQAIRTLTASAKASAIGLGATKTVADAATSATNAYGLANLSAGKSVAILFAAVREGKAEASSLAPALQRNIAIASKLGVGFDEVAAAIAAITRISGDAAKAGTGLESILFGLLRPTEQAQKIVKKLGFSFQDLRVKIAEEGLLETLQFLRDAVGDNEEALGRLFESREAVTGFLTLLGKNAAATRKTFAALSRTVSGDLDVAMSKLADSAEFKLRKQIAELNTETAKFGEKTVPGLVEGLKTINDNFATAAIAGSILLGAMIGLRAGVGGAALLGGLSGLAATVAVLRKEMLGTSEAAKQLKRDVTDTGFVPAGASLLIEAKQAETAARIKNSAAITDEQQDVLDLISDLEHERSLIGLTASEIAVSNNVRIAGAAATKSQRDSIRDLTLETIKFNEAQDLSRNVLRGFLGDLKDGKSAADAFANSLNRIADKLLDIATDKAISALFSPFGGGGLSGIGASLAASTTVSSPVFHGGGVVGSTPVSSRVVPASLFANAPRFHNGLSPDELPAILQRGERVIPRGGSAGGDITIVVDARTTIDATGAFPESIAILNTKMDQRDKALRGQIRDGVYETFNNDRRFMGTA